MRFSLIAVIDYTPDKRRCAIPLNMSTLVFVLELSLFGRLQCYSYALDGIYLI